MIEKAIEFIIIFLRQSFPKQSIALILHCQCHAFFPVGPNLVRDKAFLGQMELFAAQVEVKPHELHYVHVVKLGIAFHYHTGHRDDDLLITLGVFGKR